MGLLRTEPSMIERVWIPAYVSVCDMASLGVYHKNLW